MIIIFILNGAIDTLVAIDTISFTNTLGIISKLSVPSIS